MAKIEKRYIITEFKGMYTTREYKSRALTVPEAIDYYGYTLEVGASYSYEKGRKKINRVPKTIDSLITNLRNASSNRARNGCGSDFGYSVAVEEAVAA
jgi:hypothetical protein